jgi:predicted RNA-binding Zn-ribbon protein involved in translation (DUF1610 family)
MIGVMTRIYEEDSATSFTCSTCGERVVLRTQKFDSWQQKGVVRSRRHVCARDEAHDVGELRA